MRFSSKHHRALPVLVITALVAVAGSAGAASDTTSPPDGTAVPDDSAASDSAPSGDLTAVAADLRELGFDQIADSVDAAERR